MAGYLVSLLYLSARCLVTVSIVCLFLMFRTWVGLQCVIVTFPGNGHYLLIESPDLQTVIDLDLPYIKLISLTSMTGMRLNLTFYSLYN